MTSTVKKWKNKANVQNDSRFSGVQHLWHWVATI